MTLNAEQKDRYIVFIRKYNDGDYALAYQDTETGVSYYIPNDEREYVIAVHHGKELAKVTTFYEVGDFTYADSDYAYVLYDDHLLMRKVFPRSSAYITITC